MAHRTALTAAALALAILAPTAQAGLTTVLEDPRGDVTWTPVHHHIVGSPPEQVEPLREVLYPEGRNGSGADVEAVRIGENRTHIVVELDLVGPPPGAADCGPPIRGGTCSYLWEVTWTFSSPRDALSGRAKVVGDVFCRGGGCSEGGSFHAFCYGYPEADCFRAWEDIDRRSFRRTAPDVLQWSIRKEAFVPTDLVGIEDEDEFKECFLHDCPDVARLCRGDAFFNFRVQAIGRETVPVLAGFHDTDDTYDAAAYRIQYDSASCPETPAHPPPAVAGETTVVVDQRSDQFQQVAQAQSLPVAARPVADAVLERNGSALDAWTLRLLENRTHVALTVEVADSPPSAAECSRPQGRPEAPPRCSYTYAVDWSFYRRGDAWGPEVRAGWTHACRPTCGEEAFVRVGDGPNWTAETPMVDFRWTEAPTGVWTIDKRVFERGLDAGPGDLPEATICRGDLFSDFRFRGEAFEEHGAVWYFDHGGWWPWPEGHDPNDHPIRFDSPGCGVAGTVGGAPALAPASHGDLPQSERPGPGTTDAVALPGGWAGLAFLALAIVALAAGTAQTRRGPRR